MEREKNWRKLFYFGKTQKWCIHGPWNPNSLAKKSSERNLKKMWTWCLTAWLFLFIEKNCQNVQKCGSSLCREESVNLSHMLLGWIQILFFKTTEGLTKVSSWVSEHCLNSAEHIPNKEFLWDRRQVIVPSLHKQEICNVLLRAKAKNAKQQCETQSLFSHRHLQLSRGELIAMAEEHSNGYSFELMFFLSGIS